MPRLPRSNSQSLGWVTWSTLGLGAQGGGQFALVAVLARFLTAAEFGVVTATLIIIGIGRAVITSIGPALVQRRDLRPEHVRSAFALCNLTAIAIVAAMWASAAHVAVFFRMEQLTSVMRAMSLLFVAQAAGLVPEALLQREMRLRALAIAEIASVLVGYLPLGIGCALGGLGIWSLVAAYVGQAALKSAVLLVARPHERALWPEWAPTRDLLTFSGGFLAAGVCNFGASQGDNFVVGRWMSASALGVYGRAYQLMSMPAMFLGEVVDRVVFPLLSRHQDDRARLGLAYGRGVSLVAAIMTPASAMAIVLAPELVRVVLGPHWEAVVPPFQVLMAGLVFRTGYKISDTLARATGTVYARAWRQAVFAAAIVACALLGTHWGVTGVAAGIVTALATNYLLMAGLSLRTTGQSWLHFALLHLRGLCSGAVVAALMVVVSHAIRALTNNPFAVLSGVAVLSLLLLALAVRLAPRRVLGGDGIWLLQTLAGRASA